MSSLLNVIEIFISFPDLGKSEFTIILVVPWDSLKFLCYYVIKCLIKWLFRFQ